MAIEKENLSELQREAEASRADLVHTVDSLQSRVSPGALKNDIKEYVRDTGNSLLYDVERRIRDNPLQAAAIAAGLAFPLWRLVSSIPAPIALIGAGIALTQRPRPLRGSLSSSRKAMNGGGVSDVISHAADNLSHQMTSAADIAKQKITTLKTQTADAVDNAVHTAQDFASDSATAVSDAVSHAYDSGVEIAEKATHEVELAFDRTKDRLIKGIEEHPLVAGGVGLLIGAFVASCIPTTSAEASAFGEVSDGLKNQALNAMSEGMGVVKAAAGEVYDSAVAQTTKRGLTSDAVEDLIQQVGDKVQSAGHEAIDRMGAKAQKANGERI
jgi:ElaB/YqjD/DUF883 family membrane-anchored ribosome-binding protein